MDYEMLVNKDNLLHESFVPEDLVLVDSEYKNNIYLERKCYEQFLKMKNDLKKINYHIDVMSGYRDYKCQEKIYNKLLNEKGFNYTFRKVAMPGASEHQTGLAIDFCVYEDDKCYIEDEIKDKKASYWVHNNCFKYGFIVRYPEGKEEITKYDYEPWHLRYVGSIASYLYTKKITLEEYKNK